MFLKIFQRLLMIFVTYTKLGATALSSNIRLNGNIKREFGDMKVVEFEDFSLDSVA